jgi:hypothetical protein
MLEKSLGLMFFLKKPKNYDRGAMYVYLKVTVDGVPKDLSVKRSWEPSMALPCYQGCYPVIGQYKSIFK